MRNDYVPVYLKKGAAGANQISSSLLFLTREFEWYGKQLREHRNPVSSVLAGLLFALG